MSIFLHLDAYSTEGPEFFGFSGQIFEQFTLREILMGKHCCFTFVEDNQEQRNTAFFTSLSSFFVKLPSLSVGYDFWAWFRVRVEKLAWHKKSRLKPKNTSKKSGALQKLIYIGLNWVIFLLHLNACSREEPWFHDFKSNFWNYKTILWSITKEWKSNVSTFSIPM